MKNAGSPPKHTSGESAGRAEEVGQEDSDRLREKVGVVIGIATGILGALLTVGLTFLPASTLAEKSYIFLACLSLSIVAVSGIGAWKSLRRFTITASFTSIAIMCLSALAISAANPVAVAHEVNRNSSPGVRQPKRSTSVPIDKPHSSPEATSSRGISGTQRGAGSSQSLLDMTAIDPADSLLVSGYQTVNTRQYQQTLFDNTLDEYGCGDDDPDSTSYNLGRKYAYFHAIVGLADSSPSGDAVTFDVLVDGQRKGIAPTLYVGQTAILNIDITGAFRITLQDLCTAAQDSSNNNSITAVWANPSVG